LWSNSKRRKNKNVLGLKGEGGREREKKRKKGV
jgi:hypothetical protein